jgi:chromosome segregation ATPase
VIELADLTTGPESDVNRLKSGIAALAADMRQIRGEQASLASNYETLSSELRDIKLVLAKVHANELRVSERSNSWFQPLPWVHAIFRKNNKPDKI